MTDRTINKNTQCNRCLISLLRDNIFKIIKQRAIFEQFHEGPRFSEPQYTSAWYQGHHTLTFSLAFSNNIQLTYLTASSIIYHYDRISTYLSAYFLCQLDRQQVLRAIQCTIIQCKRSFK